MIDAALVFALEPACAACRGRLSSPLGGCVCDECWANIPRIGAHACRRCGAPHAPRHGACRQCDPRWHVIAASSALGEYDGPLRDILHALKYARRTSIAGVVARELRASCDVLDGADAVVPVPLHPLRSWWRGFNQARLIAGDLGLPVVDALVRRRATARQASLTRDDRWSNLHAVIGARRHTAQRLRGATVVIVDDVVTTGATVTACARALREAGVAEVRVATAARAVRRSPR